MTPVHNVILDRVDEKCGRFEFPCGRLKVIPWSQIEGGAMVYDADRPRITISVTPFLLGILRSDKLIDEILIPPTTETRTATRRKKRS